jgi:Na+/H+ antiporter 1
VITGAFLARAFTSPITIGIFAGYVAGKPIGTAGGAWLVIKLSRGRLRLPAGWASVTGAGTIAGVGVTVSLLIAELAFHGEQLDQAKAGVLAAAIAAALLTWVVFQVTSLLPKPLRLRALLGTATVIIDLAAPVDPRRDHIRGPKNTADLGSVSGTPTFFINGQRHYGAYDIDSLKEAVRTARALAAIAA